jgi:TetR/AcrR family transcriptional repressor of nem operon
MARQKEFEHDTVLQKALEVFWAQGYAATSTDDLLRAMQIGRQSMYDTFGDKRTLYLKTLRRYTADSVGEFVHSLRIGAPQSPLAGLQAALYKFADKPAAYRARGCMGVNATCEFGADDEDVALILETSGMMLAAALRHLIADARQQRELGAAVDDQAAVDFIAATLIGMKVSAKSGASVARLRQIADIAIAGLRAMR